VAEGRIISFIFEGRAVVARVLPLYPRHTLGTQRLHLRIEFGVLDPLIPMSGPQSDVGYGDEAPLMDGGRGDGLHDRQSPITAGGTEPRHPDGSGGEKSSANPRIAACEDFKEESGGVSNAGESSTLPDSDSARRPSARRSALSNTFCQAGGASRDDGARELSRGNDAAKAAGGEKEDALDSGRKRVRDGRGNPTPEGHADGVPPTSNKSVRREGEGAAVEPPLPRSYTLDTGIPSHDDDGDESDEGLPMPPDLLDPPDNDAQQFTGALTGLRKFSDASKSEGAGEEGRMPGHACHTQAPLQGEGGGAGSPSKAFACGSKSNAPTCQPDLLRLLGARLAALDSAMRPGRESAQRLPRVLEIAASRVAFSAVHHL
jgi:hypothetical protein